jgi:hypothetical protein
MSKFMCHCGEIIRDQTDHSPYKGHVFPDTEFFDLFDLISAEITNYIHSRVAGHEAEWIAQNLSQRNPGTNDEDIVYHIIARHLIHASMDLYQCSKCGRLHVERRDDKSLLESFTPDTTPHRDVFRK